MLLHELVQQKISQSAGNGVIRCGEVHLSYAELNAKANALAHVLISQSIGNGKRVGICLDRSVEMVIAALAILKAGGCYVPVEPGFPKDRIDFILADSQAVCVISSGRYKNSIVHQHILCIDETDTSSYPQINPVLDIPDCSLAYIIYTSGTTGQPKGTMIEHRNVVTVLGNSSRVFDFQSTDGWTCVHSICFDFSVWEIFGGLIYGKELVIVPKEVMKNVVMFMELIKPGTTILSLTPTAFYSLMDYFVKEEHPSNFALRYVILGGEAVSPTRLKEWHEKFSNVKLINGYGVTEAAIFFSFKEVTAELIASNSSNIGTPIPGLKNYVCNNNMHEIGEGEVGELYIGGKAVGRGYINQPELQAKHFVADPFDQNGLLYRTGDHVRRLPGHEMEYIGRIDNQVKIRGYRIELGEIERNIYGYGGIKNAVATVYKTALDESYLTAYIVWEIIPVNVRLLEEGLRAYLSGKLPEYMMPFYYVFLDEMPMTNSGKADKSKLPAPLQGITKSIRMPQTNEQQIMAGIWSEVLGIERESIGVDASFFDLGGHSLLLTRLSAEIFYRYAIHIPIEELFSDPTVEKLAVYLQQPVSGQATGNSQEDSNYNAEATISQKILFFGNKLNPNEAFPNSGISYEVIGDVDLSRLEKAFDKVIRDNEGLRMTFYMENGKVLHKVCSDFQFEIQRIKSFSKEIDEEIIALTRPFNFGKCPLLRVFYIESPGDRRFLYVDMPHINSDGVSLEVMISEVTAHYNEQPVSASKKKFSDYLKYYRSYLGSDQYKSDQSYWEEHFDTSIPFIHFRSGSDNTAITGFSGVSRVIKFPDRLSTNLNRYLRTKNFTKFQFLLASYFLFLRKITTEDDLSVMIPLHNRSIKGFENIIGLLANRSVVRMKTNQGKSINSFISECKAGVLQAVHHTAYPFEWVFEEQGKGKRYRKPLYQTFFNYHNHRQESKLGDARLKLHIHNKAKEILPLSIDIFDMGDEHVLRILSASGIYSRTELDELSAGLFDLVETIIENDEASIQSLFGVPNILQTMSI